MRRTKERRTHFRSESKSGTPICPCVWWEVRHSYLLGVEGVRKRVNLAQLSYLYKLNFDNFVKDIILKKSSAPWCCCCCCWKWVLFTRGIYPLVIYPLGSYLKLLVCMQYLSVYLMYNMCESTSGAHSHFWPSVNQEWHSHFQPSAEMGAALLFMLKSECMSVL